MFNNVLKRKVITMCAIAIMSLGVLAGCSGEPSEKDDAQVRDHVEINVSAAASLTDSLNEIATMYSEKCDDSILFNYAGSGALVKQIEEGAPCDLFISASKSDMDKLEEGSLIDVDTRMDLLKNTLTLIASEEKADVIKGVVSFTDDQVKSIAIGTPESVPAGKYAKQLFESLSIWDPIQPKLVLAKDVKQVLEYVETGNVDCGLVYKSDAMLLKSGKIVEDIDEKSHDPIVYPAAILTESAEKVAVQEFYDFIKTDEAKAVFEKYGFKVI